MNEKKLEEKLLYRLIKVLYMIALLLSVLITLWIGWEARPQSEVDDERSHIACNNGKTYLLSKNSFYIYSVDDTLSSSKDVEARKLCAYDVLNNYSTTYRNLETPVSINYQLKIVEGTRGSWSNSFLWWVLGTGALYTGLNLVREILNYILFGKSFDWMWLIVPILLMTSSDDEK